MINSLYGIPMDQWSALLSIKRNEPITPTQAKVLSAAGLITPVGEIKLTDRGHSYINKYIEYYKSMGIVMDSNGNIIEVRQ